MLILNTLRDHPGTKILYIVPNRALVYELTGKLVELFSPLGYFVAAVTPQLIALEEEEASRVLEASVLVLTPERRQICCCASATWCFTNFRSSLSTKHTILNRARVEYCWKCISGAQTAPERQCPVCLPVCSGSNIREIASWMGARPGSVVVNTRPTRMRAGVYRIQGKGRTGKGVIEYTDGNSLTVISSEIENRPPTTHTARTRPRGSWPSLNRCQREEHMRTTRQPHG